MIRSQQVPDLPGPIPQPPPDGTLNEGPLRPELAVPKTENCFSRSSLAHLGHATVLEDESTRVSNRWPQARQEYSKSGMASEEIRAIGNQAIGQSGNRAIRQSGNRAIGQSGNQATRQSGYQMTEQPGALTGPGTRDADGERR